MVFASAGVGAGATEAARAGPGAALATAIRARINPRLLAGRWWMVFMAGSG